MDVPGGAGRRCDVGAVPLVLGIVAHAIGAKWKEDRAEQIRPPAPPPGCILCHRDPNQVGDVDARSEAFGVGDPAPLGLEARADTMEGGTYPEPAPYIERFQRWGGTPNTKARDKLVITASNISWLSVDVRRARLSCRAEVVGTVDQATTVRLEGCNRSVLLKP